MNPAIAAAFGLHDYQIQAADFALAHPKCGLFLKMGLGKSRITLAAIAELNPPCHVLLIAPVTIARSSWSEEIRKIGLNIRCKSLIINERGKKLSKKKRYQLYEEAFSAPPTLYFINRDLVTDIVGYYGNRWPFGIVIVDELQSFKSYKAVRFKALAKTIPYTQRFIGLTGTPRPKSLEDLWSQIYLMDSGARLGPNITWYRNNFFRPGFRVNAQGYPYEWEPLPWAQDEITRRISDLVISMDNVQNLPPLTYNNIYAYMDDAQLAQYRQMAKTCVFQYGQTEDEVVAAASAGVLAQKLAQMASGFLYTDKEHHYITLHTAKLEVLQYIYDNEPEPILVAYYFQTDKIAITGAFADAVVFDGTQEMQDSWNRGEIRMMLIQPASAGFGINIQFGGHTLVWYTLTSSLEQYQQTNARLYRQGQTQPVVIHHILTKYTQDEAALARMNKKDNDQELLLEAVRFIMDDNNDAA